MTTTLLSDRIHHFGTLTLDERIGTLSRGDEQLVLRPKAHALMLHRARSIFRVDIRAPGLAP
jgi:DNA-binding winged helix-turn-helix (wHTH) protein